MDKRKDSDCVKLLEKIIEKTKSKKLPEEFKEMLIQFCFLAFMIGVLVGIIIPSLIGQKSDPTQSFKNIKGIAEQWTCDSIRETLNETFSNNDYGNYLFYSGVWFMKRC